MRRVLALALPTSPYTRPMSNDTPARPDRYAELLEDLKRRIGAARVAAALAVNRELVLLYWSIGRDILLRQEQEGWGAKVIEQLAHDLRKAFPEVTGFSTRNLLFMRSFAQAWADEQIVKQAVSQIPWGHNIRLIQKVKDPTERRSKSSRSGSPRRRVLGKPNLEPQKTPRRSQTERPKGICTPRVSPRNKSQPS